MSKCPDWFSRGGTFRPVFSCGVMDALLDNNVMFDYVIGVSAGITYAVSYVSRQRGRNIEVLRRYRRDKRYLGARNLPRDRVDLRGGVRVLHHPERADPL